MGLYGIDCVQWGVQYLPGDEGATVHLLWREILVVFVRIGGLWYTKDSGFELTEFSDADYAGCKDTFKSTSGGAQFLGEKLVSLSLKKQDSYLKDMKFPQTHKRWEEYSSRKLKKKSKGNRVD
nr:uncharacterized mitochondrial protein AtMg00810-like [Tanacetum cinerariifolium]